jgi:hypothetical protein
MKMGRLLGHESILKWILPRIIQGTKEWQRMVGIVRAPLPEEGIIICTIFSPLIFYIAC